MFSNSGNTSDGTTGQGLTNTIVTQNNCPADFTKDITLSVYDEIQRGLEVENVTLHLWKVEVDENGEDKDVQISTSEGIVFEDNTDYKILVSKDGYKNNFAEFSVENCKVTGSTLVYLQALPTSLDVTFKQDDLVGTNAVDNRIIVSADDTITIETLLKGQKETMTDAIIVFNANKDQYVVETADLSAADVPEEHSSGADDKEYAFDLGTINENTKMEFTFDLIGDEDLVAGDYNVTYTIYQYQEGYIDEDLGDFVAGSFIEAQDTILLPVFEGTVFVTAE